MSKRKKIIVVTISIVLIIGIILSITFGMLYNAKDKSFENYIVLGYLPSWVYESPEDLKKTDFSKLTHINFSFSLIDPVTYLPTITQEQSGQLNMLMQYLKENNFNTKVLVSLGGGGAGNFCEGSRSEAKRIEFAKACAEIVDKFKIDGIDVDWEYPGYDWGGISRCKHCRKDYVLLLQEIRKAIGNEKLLTIAGNSAITLMDDYDLRALNKILDFVNIMNYDYNNTKHSDFSFTKTSLFSYYLAGFPKTKLNVGVPFYGRSDDEKYQWMGYDNIMKLIDSGNATLKEAANQSYAKIDGSTICFDTPNLVRKKGKFAKEHGYGGIFCWQLGTDRDGEMVDAMWSEFYGENQTK